MNSLAFRIWKFCFSNFMWLYIIMALLMIAGIYMPGYQLLMFICFLFSVTLISKQRNRNGLDVMVLIFIIYILLNSLFIDYPNHFKYWYTAFFYSLCPISCYYIAKTVDYDIEEVLAKMMVPITIAMLFGVVFYILNPAWYSAMKYAALYAHSDYTEGGYIPERVIKETFRLSSFWHSPYYIGYANCIFSIFLLVKLFCGKLMAKEKLWYWLLFILSLVVMVLAQFKSVLLSFAIWLVLVFMVTNKANRKKLFWGMSLLSFLLVAYFVFINTEFGDYFTQRFNTTASAEGLSDRLEHTGGGVDLFTFFGNGYGRYGITARSFDKWAIEDSEYQKVLGELGVFGFAIFCMMLLMALYMANKRKLTLELCILCFYVISFIGKSSISYEDTFSFIFWYMMGSISKKSSIRYKLRVPLKAVG